MEAELTEVMAVVKGGAYGSGVMGVVGAVLEAGATELAVATVSEGVFLRTQGVAVPIAVLGNLNPEELPDVLTYRLHPTVGWARAFQQSEPISLKYHDGSPLEVHVEIDTGMSRFGVQPQDLAELMTTLDQRGIKVRSLYTHFQSAITERDLNKRQYDSFIEATKAFPGIRRHAAATTGCVQGLGGELDFIRPGGAVTGLCSGSSEADVKAFAELGFQPSFSLVARPSFYKLLEPCRGVGYDSTYTSSSHEWIANFNTGWSDGLARKLSNCGHVLRIKTGELCPIVGRVSMDSMTVRVPEEPGAEETFVIITPDFHPLTSAVGVARSLGAAVYEVPGNWGSRLPRVTVEGGKVKQVYRSLEYTN
ncbi:alanine racemase isoform X2 [Hyalella azteca]|uniref:Alanine racemase isoform X2 n=1 Tax=Hyalella azteca TaxID=294128 RepID=A0A8B7NME3_HYAAZ|nr:alanine racemase isoform X2 [Hyalella azteca]